MIEEKLIRYVKQTYLPERLRGKAAAFTARDLRFFLPAIADLSAAFTSERGARSQNYFNRKECRSAYLLYFFLTNYRKVWHTLAELDRLHQLPLADRLQVLDVGAGPATASIACANYYSAHHPACQLDIVALEQNEGTLRDARALFATVVDEKHRLSAQQTYLTAPSAKRSLGNRSFDLIFAVNVLNELPSIDERYRLCLELLQRLRGRLIVIDPALRKQTRDLMALRDRLLEQGDAAVLAPCLHQQRCPMLAANRRDWCHFYIEWECPQLIRDIDRQIGNRHDYLKMAYMIFTASPPLKVRGGGGCYDSEGSGQLARVVSSPMRSKGKTELLVCGDDGQLTRLTELDRSRAKGAHPFGGAKRGQVLTFATSPKK